MDGCLARYKDRPLKVPPSPYVSILWGTRQNVSPGTETRVSLSLSPALCFMLIDWQTHHPYLSHSLQFQLGSGLAFSTSGLLLERD